MIYLLFTLNVNAKGLYFKDLKIELNPEEGKEWLTSTILKAITIYIQDLEGTLKSTSKAVLKSITGINLGVSEFIMQKCYCMFNKYKKKYSENEYLILRNQLIKSKDKSILESHKIKEIIDIAELCTPK